MALGLPWYHIAHIVHQGGLGISATNSNFLMFDNYPLVNSHSYGKWLVLIGQLSTYYISSIFHSYFSLLQRQANNQIIANTHYFERLTSIVVRKIHVGQSQAENFTSSNITSQITPIHHILAKNCMMNPTALKPHPSLGSTSPSIDHQIYADVIPCWFPMDLLVHLPQIPWWIINSPIKRLHDPAW